MAKSASEVLKPKSDKKAPKKRGDAMLDFISKHKKHDFGKHNNGKTTGFKAVERKAEKEYGSEEAGEKVAGAVFAKMKGK